MSAWTDHVAKWKDCQSCPLACQRSRIVLCRGSLPCDVLFVGEAPGMSEDALGQPFVGPAGKLLDGIVAEAGLDDWQEVGTRTFCRSYAFTNLVACFPREAKREGINEPEPAEIKACGARLEELVGIAKPRLIVCVGKLAAEWLDPKAWKKGYPKIGEGVPRVDIAHPAAILRANQAQQGLMVKRCVIQISNAVEEL